MKAQRHAENRGAVSDWENDGGARSSSDAERPTAMAPVASDRRRSRQEQIDASHQSDTRGEHRYADVHQTRTEQENRQKRDDLKRRLAGPRRPS